jgi:ABC-2 type transport system permease protein
MSAPTWTPEQLGPPIKGPSALGSDWHRFRHLTWVMATTDFKLRFFGSALGYLWQLMRPLLLFGVLLVVFTELIDLGSGVPYYADTLLLGIVLYTFFSEATKGAVNSLVLRENLVRKIEFPRLAVPMANVTTATFNLGLNMIPMLIFLLAAGAPVRWSWLEMPFLLVALAVLVVALCMLLSVLFVRYRDVEPIWDVVLQVFFYASGIFLPVQLALEQHEWLGRAMMFNPFTTILTQARHAFIDPRNPSAAEAIGSGWLLLVPAAITVLLLVVGFRVFEREAPRIAEEL